MKNRYYKNTASFRDRDGFIFSFNNEIYRAINRSYQENYDSLVKSGLFKELIKLNLLIPYQEVKNTFIKDSNIFKILKPNLIEFISYPYEWCFSQLKDAALATLQIEKIALAHNMTIKDASAFNIQFYKGKPVLIDILSFEKYVENQPWVAYKQFCQHFLGPLALISYKDPKLNSLSKNFIDGPPLDLISKLLPFKTYFNFSLLIHIHIHSKFQNIYSNKTKKMNKINNLSKKNLILLIESLESTVRSLKWLPKNTEWVNYYNKTNYSKKSLTKKKEIVLDYLNKIGPNKVIWDLGANDGTFSRLGLKTNASSVFSFDIDPAAVEINYLKCKKNNETNHLPLIIDLTNPSPSIGWENKERLSFMERVISDTVIALALIHHLAISNNLGLDLLASFFSKICKNLIIEFIPKEDSNVQRLLNFRKDIFNEYNEDFFIKTFSKFFLIKERRKIKGSKRIIFLMIKK